MNSMDLQKIGVKELTIEEQNEIQGGWIGLALAFLLGTGIGIALWCVNNGE